MSDDIAFVIALWAGGISFGGFAALTLLGALVSNLRRTTPRPVGPIGALFGAAVLGGVPIAIATFAGLFASAALIGIETPPIAYLFVGAASCLCFALALNWPSHGMEGCTKMFAVMWSAYAVVWSALSFWMLGGAEGIGRDAASLAWARPLLVALPYAAIFARLADRKRRTFGKIAGAFILLSALFALMFLPVEAGLVGRWLPASDWLRFPIAALLVALLFAILPALLALHSSPAIRKRRRRELPRQAALLSLILLPAGLLWAGARALTGTLA